jgi:galactokinase
MGDHIDYNGLSVLPMALQRHVALLYREREDAAVQIASTNPLFTSREFELSTRIEPYEDGDWGNYVKAACRAMMERYGAKLGLEAVVHSDIPIASGLSSSSALVVASALAVLHANDVWTEKMELAEYLAEAEHYVGTRGGGMDQAICLAARRNSVSRIDFEPLRLTAHPIPPEWHFIVAFSLVRAEKAGALRDAYNARTRECGAALTRMIEGLELAGTIDSYPGLIAESHANELLARAGDILDDDTLLRRFVHVISEAERVRRAEKALLDYDLKAFGHLMTDSHQSLGESFDVSIPELDELVYIAVKAGAAGARLTGAGLGGCVVALCPDKKSRRVMKALADRYYEKREYEGPLEDQLFVAEPSGGASVTPL